MHINNLFVYLILLTIWCNSCESPQPADLVIKNGSIYTMDPKKPLVQAVGVKDGKIVFVGSEEKVSSRIGEETTVLDLKGKTMTPGIIESHAHLMSMGYHNFNLDLNNVKSYDQLIEKVKQAVSQAQPGDWIQGRGWHQSKWNELPATVIKGFPTHPALTAISPDNPVFLTHASGHAALVNQKAMDMAGITSSSEFDETGEIIKDAKSQPTGLLNEEAIRLVSNIIPKNTLEKDRQALRLAIDECLSNGITSFHDAGVGQDRINLYQEFLSEGSLNIRLWVMLNGQDQKLIDRWLEQGPEIGLGQHFLSIAAIKLYADGALGSRGAWLLEEYSDQPGNLGNPDMDLDLIYQICSKALESGFQVCTHAIGDRANREVLNQYELAFRENYDAASQHRFRIEHAQHLHTDDIPRFADLGVIAAMQAIHMSSDRPWAINRLGQTRIDQGAYVWQKLLQTGAKVINGTDAPVEPINPIASFFASVTRQTLDGQPDGGYEASQKMTREQALRSYTLDAAYGAKEEHLKGSIEVGKLADFTVFSQDIMEIPDSELMSTQVDFTIINGKIQFQRVP